MRTRVFYLPIVITSLLLPICAFADLSLFSSTQNSTVEANKLSEKVGEISANQVNTALNAMQLQAEANRWGLTADDYQRYLVLMQTTPSGKWYAQSDPAEVLAINARNETERQKFVLIVAKSTHDRLENELAMQRSFNIAWQKLYPNLKPIELPSQNSKNNATTLTEGDQLLLFTNTDNANSYVVPQLISAVRNHTNTKLAIFIVGTVTDKAIQDWAQQNAIPAALVQKGVIILDHDKGRFAKLNKGTQILPTIILNHSGSFNVVSLNDLSR